MRLRDYHDAALKNSAVCFDCRRPVTSDQKLHHYDHSSGWKVTGYGTLQWLYFVCTACSYQTSFAKLGFKRPTP